MPWINKASLALYIARIVTRGWPARYRSSATNLKFERNTVLSSSSLCLKHRKLSLSRLRVDLILDAISVISGASINRCLRILLTTFYHMHHYTMQLLGIWSSAHIIYDYCIYGKQTSYLCVFSSVEKAFISQYTTLYRRGSQFCIVHTICIHHQ